ncbi:MAG: prolipoprotein diacylglyceryl transferase, partial [Nitrospirae bacterium]|nr:prolipoprotein diacylglyceryl transferase [Nitrospirota bacterium]
DAVLPPYSGLGLYGGIIGAAIGIWIFVRGKDVSISRALDVVVPGTLLAQGIARWGNFFNQELYGPPTDLPWGITIAAENRLPQYAELIEHGVNGFLVDPDEGDLAGALIGVLSDPGLKRDIARRNRDLVVKISDQDQEMSRMESWYFKLAAASSNGGPAD